MASAINTANASGLKGCFPIGTGELVGPNFCNSLPPPADPVTGAILPGYSLNTNATSATGLEWNFSGVGASGIKQYKFPANSTPNPFPTPAEAGSDIVLIQREDIVTSGYGLQDLSMPILGAQGFIPEHNLPSLCDSRTQVVFFFDRANAAINVYNILTKTWRIGWLKAVPTPTFSWRAASLLTGDLLKTDLPSYAAPYDIDGIFISAVSSNWKSNNPSTNVTNIPSNFIFVRYTVSAGEIDPVLPGDITDVTNGATGDWAVSAICAVNQNEARFDTPSYAPAVNEIVCAFAVDETSDLTYDGLTGISYGWWGFMGRIVSGGAKTALNVNLSVVTNFNSLANFTIKTAVGSQSGYIQTISVTSGFAGDDRAQFFLGGNFFRILFNGTAVTRDFGGNTQTSSVAMLYNYPAASAPTITNYVFVGQNIPAVVGPVVNWRGRIIQSNFANNYFYFCGSFVAPPSTSTDGQNEGQNTQTTVTQFIPVTEGYSFQIEQPTITQGISALIAVRNELLGGTLTTLNIQMPLNNVFPNVLNVATTSTEPGLCYSIIPIGGNLTQASYPLLQIGGSMNLPLQYQNTSVADFQTRLKVVPREFWYSSIELYVETAITVNIIARVYQASSDPVAAQFQYALQNVTFVPGLNTIPIYGGGTAPTNGNLMNSNIISSVAGVVPLNGSPEYMRASLFFYQQGDFTFTIPQNVPLGINLKNGQQPFEYVWNLTGYPITPAVANNYYSPLASNASYPFTGATRRTLRFSNLSVPVPLTADVLQIQLIPINQQTNRLLVATSPFIIGLVAEIFVFKDFLGGATTSGMINKLAPMAVQQIPKLTGGIVSQPTFSVFGNSELEVYKIGWANQDQVAFGIYTSFPQYSGVPYILIADGLPPINAGEIAFSGAQSLTPNTLLSIRVNQQDTFAGLVDWSKVGSGDVVTISNAGNTAQQQTWYVLSAVTGPVNNYYTISAQLLSGNQIFAATTDLQITATLIRDPEAQPLVLKESLGFYLLGNGYSSAQRDVILSSYTNTGKAYRYVPSYDNTVLLFDSEVYVGGAGVDNTFTADALVFNTNYSSALLSKSDVDETKWVVTSTYGSIGYSNLSK